MARGSEGQDGLQCAGMAAARATKGHFLEHQVGGGNGGLVESESNLDHAAVLPDGPDGAGGGGPEPGKVHDDVESEASQFADVFDDVDDATLFGQVPNVAFGFGREYLGTGEHGDACTG